MSDALSDAQTLYQESLDEVRDQRIQIEEDLRFSDPSDPQQWDDAVRVQRETDPGGKRPCLVMDQTGQYVANVAGQIEKQPPAIHAIPVGGGADKQAAEQIDGRFRHIEHASKAAQHYALALTSAARTGVGYLVVRPEYVDRALGWQEPRISSEPDPLRVVFDPWSQHTDGSDADSGFILTAMSITAGFNRRWPGKEARDFGDIETSSRRRDDRKQVLIAEQWLKVSQTRNIIVYTGADGIETSGREDDYHAACQAAGAQLPFIRNYNDKTQSVKWRRMSGADILEESEYPADSIGIVPVYGYVGFSDGRMRYCGIPRRARAPQQAYNYHVSEQLAFIGTAPKSPWLASKRAVAGLEKIWDQASTQSRAWLPYVDQDADGAINQPSRVNTATNIVNHEAGAAQALRDIQASIGMYAANLGAQSNETSGVAIESRKQQGEASTAHFPSHMAASLGQVGNLVMQMDARLSDTQRKQPIIGVDGSAGSVNINPEQKTSFERSPDGVSINPSVGKYGVRVVVGASYSTQRSQTNAAFAEIMRGNKELAATVAPFWAQTLDFPGSDKFSQAMAAMAPPAVKAILQPEGQEDAPDPAKLAQELDQCKQALQEALQHAKEAQDDADEAIAGQADAKRLAEVRERELDIQAYNAETARFKVTGANEEQAKAIVNDLIQQMLNNPDPLPGEAQEPPSDDMEVDEYTARRNADAESAPDSEMQSEPMEPAPPPEPPPPSPELLAMMQGQGKLAEAVGHLIEYSAKPRVRTAHRDKLGNLTHTTDSIGE
jgi:Phage P22-like portal protein